MSRGLVILLRELYKTDVSMESKLKYMEGVRYICLKKD
jgi:hypothetical protein